MDLEQLQDKSRDLERKAREGRRVEMLRQAIEKGDGADAITLVTALQKDPEMNEILLRAGKKAWATLRRRLAKEGVELPEGLWVPVDSGVSLWLGNDAFAMGGLVSKEATSQRVGEADLEQALAKAGLVVSEAAFAPAPAQSDDDHFNSPDMLAPVGCDLVLKLPCGKRVSAFRTKHLAERSGDIEYRLPDDSLILGRFPWTYP